MTRPDVTNDILNRVADVVDICRRDTLDAMAQSDRALANTYELLAGAQRIIRGSQEG